MIDVPLGTSARREDNEALLGEVRTEGEECILLAGGSGGWGNAHYVNARRQAPDYATSGEAGEAATIVFTLRLLANVGLIGMPNAGKSTLLSRVSAARPAVGSYAFTTLAPSVGVVGVDMRHSFVMADLPGLIQGASEGRGLGFQFLQHVEKNQVLAFIISCEEANPRAVYGMLLQELVAYDASLEMKPRMIVISKCDLIDSADAMRIKGAFGTDSPPMYFVSSHSEAGLAGFKTGCWRILQNV